MRYKNYWKVIRFFSFVGAVGFSLLIGGVSFASAQGSNNNQKTITAKSVKAKSKSKQKKTLYARLGGYDAISAVVEDFADKLFDDPKIF